MRWEYRHFHMETPREFHDPIRRWETHHLDISEDLRGETDPPPPSPVEEVAGLRLTHYIRSERVLDALGAEGWEVVAAWRPADPDGPSSTLEVVMKRRAK